MVFKIDPLLFHFCYIFVLHIVGPLSVHFWSMFVYIWYIFVTFLVTSQVHLRSFYVNFMFILRLFFPPDIHFVCLEKMNPSAVSILKS